MDSNTADVVPRFCIRLNTVCGPCSAAAEVDVPVEVSEDANVNGFRCFAVGRAR